MDSTVSFLDIVNEEQKVMGESKEFDSENLFFVGKTDNGADIRCKSAEEFQNSYLTLDIDELNFHLFPDVLWHYEMPCKCL
jgi:hypothetical protein